MKKPVAKNRRKLAKKVEPFLLPENDPDYIEPEPPNNSNLPSKPKKVLTNPNRFARLRIVNKAKKKGDKMATDKQKTSNKNDKLEVLKSIAWLLEAAFRGFVGWALLTHSTSYVATAAALYALGTAGVIVVSHFVRAHR